MENNVLFDKGKLKSFIQAMATRFLLVEEFPFENRGEEIQFAREKVRGVLEKELEKYAVSLGGRDVENIIFACFEKNVEKMDKDAEVDTKLLKVLEIRMSKRILAIIWQLYQFKYKEENPNLILILKMAVEYSEREALKTPEAEMMEIFYKGNGKNRIVEMLNGQGLPINSFAWMYKFNLKGPMLKSIAKMYLSQCEKAAYNFNEAWMNRIIHEVGVQRLTDLVVNYLTCFTENEYTASINMSILEKMGYPYSSLEWEEVPEALKRKFSNWNALRALEGHFQSKTNNKYLLLSQYISSAEKVFFLRDEQLLVIDFGEFVVIDDCILMEYSFLVEKVYFEKIREELEINPIASFVKSRGLLYQAREFIIDELESTVFQLDYREVGKLYIKKTLDIMLGLEEDTRQSKEWLQIKKVAR